MTHVVTSESAKGKLTSNGEEIVSPGEEKKSLSRSPWKLLFNAQSLKYAARSLTIFHGKNCYCRLLPTSDVFKLEIQAQLEFNVKLVYLGTFEPE